MLRRTDVPPQYYGSVLFFVQVTFVSFLFLCLLVILSLKLNVSLKVVSHFYVDLYMYWCVRYLCLYVRGNIRNPSCFFYAVLFFGEVNMFFK